jgi:SAM-dependent methyltransferase
MTPDPQSFYVNGSFEEKNPTWDAEDSEWKTNLVIQTLRANGVVPTSILEVGCGAGAIIASLRHHFPKAYLAGSDIAPGAQKFWKLHSALSIDFILGDFLETNTRRFNVLLLLDVIEHVANPHEFLRKAAKHAEFFVFHIPLDLSVASVLRETPLIHVRRKVGHIHYFTKCLALELLVECGYEVIYTQFSGAHLRQCNSWRRKVAANIRNIVFTLNRNVGVRLLGGDTLVAMARRRDE